MKKLLIFAVLLLSVISSAQERPSGIKVKVSGTVIDNTTNTPLEYTTITLVDANDPSRVNGGLTDANGKFSFDVTPGTYNIRIEFMSFTPIDFNQRVITTDTNLGTISLTADTTLLEGVVIRQEVSTVDIKLDKKVYNVGQDMMVKGGTVSDVLDNVPSVTVDVEGNVSLRGNENVRILIDGKPSGLGGINIAEALKLIPADAIDKVEVITNPSARYDAEGGGGILNIILKKGKNQGINGTFTAATGTPTNNSITGTVNYKREQFNIFTTQGYRYSKGPGNAFTNTEYLDGDQVTGYLDESRDNERRNKSYNANFGVEWYLGKNTTWTNAFSYRKSSGENADDVFQARYDEIRDPISNTSRFNDESSRDEDVEYSTNFLQKFKGDGHQLTVDASFSQSDDNDRSDINSIERIFASDIELVGNQRTANLQTQTRNLIQADYVLPIGKVSRLELGYRGSFSDLLTDYMVEDYQGSQWVNNDLFSNILQYKEKVNALYASAGTKVNRFSYLLGMRWEDSNIDINQRTQDIYTNKRYNNFFPSAFVAYEFSESSSVSLSYSKRISRPRSRSINPFSSMSSNINMFRGNPDLDPSLSDVFDIGYLKRWSKVTLSTSMYFNRTSDAVQYVSNVEVLDSGDEVLVTSPVNIGREERFGFEFTLSYNAARWWKLNSNLNLFRNQTIGSYEYLDLTGENLIIEDFSNTAYTGFARINSKVNLPYGVDWQTNVTYNAPQTNAQGSSRGILSANLAFSKDILKDKGTIALNVSDLFNSRKRIVERNLVSQNTYSEMQWRERQINLSFTYRFNKKKNEREQNQNREQDNEDGFMGG